MRLPRAEGSHLVCAVSSVNRRQHPGSGADPLVPARPVGIGVLIGFGIRLTLRCGVTVGIHDQGVGRRYFVRIATGVALLAIQLYPHAFLELLIDLGVLLERSVGIGGEVVGKIQRPGKLLGIGGDVASGCGGRGRGDVRVLVYSLVVSRAVEGDVISLPVAEVNALHDFGIHYSVRGLHVAFRGESTVGVDRQCSPCSIGVALNVLGDDRIGLADSVRRQRARNLRRSLILVEQQDRCGRKILVGVINADRPCAVDHCSEWKRTASGRRGRARS